MGFTNVLPSHSPLHLALLDRQVIPRQSGQGVETVLIQTTGKNYRNICNLWKTLVWIVLTAFGPDLANRLLLTAKSRAANIFPIGVKLAAAYTTSVASFLAHPMVRGLLRLVPKSASSLLEAPRPSTP